MTQTLPIRQVSPVRRREVFTLLLAAGIVLTVLLAVLTIETFAAAPGSQAQEAAVSPGLLPPMESTGIATFLPYLTLSGIAILAGAAVVVGRRFTATK